MNSHRVRFFFTLFLAAAAASVTQPGFAGKADETLTSLGSATYTGIEDEPVTLVDGRWQGEPYIEGGASRPRVGLLDNIYFKGDLDADGLEETVALLWQSSAGTGSNIYIAALQTKEEGYDNISTALLGDRVKLIGGKIESGKLILEVLQAGENDAMCCPTMLATRTFSLKDTQLEESEMEVTGHLSLGILDGSHWRLVEMNHQPHLPEDADVTLSFNAGRISGKSACNRYSADITEGDEPGDVLVGQALGTRMACTDSLMALEQQYLESLSQVTGFSFDAGRLALSGQDSDGALFLMLFMPDGMEAR
jgi:heat shock protein HslJ